MTNTIWFCGIILFALLNSNEPKKNIGKILHYLLTLVSGMSGVFAIALLPLFILRALVEKTSYRYVMAGCIGVSAVIEFTCKIIKTPPLEQNFYNIFEWLQVLDERTMQRIFFNNLWFPWDMRGSMISGIFLLSFVSYSFYKSIRAKNFLIFSAISFVTILLFGVTIRINNPMILARTFNGDRYFFIPTFFIALILVELFKITKKKTEKIIIVFLLMLYFAVGIKLFKLEGWPESDWPKKSACIGGDKPCVVVTHPESWTISYDPSWKFIRAWQRH